MSDAVWGVECESPAGRGPTDDSRKIRRGARASERRPA